MSSQQHTIDKNSLGVIALIGNPNSGKSTIFNHLTGAKQHIANYPGVTVEKKTGAFSHRAKSFEVIDLPGTYGLGADSIDEQITRQMVLHQEAGLLVNVVDACNLERSLYLTIQLLELGLNLALVLNMSDEAKSRGITIDTTALSKSLGVPVIPTIGVKGLGISELQDTVAAIQLPTSNSSHPLFSYPDPIEHQAAELSEIIKEHCKNFSPQQTRWMAIKLLEGDNHILELLNIPCLKDHCQERISKLQKHLGGQAAAQIIARRYDFLTKICRSVVEYPPTEHRSISERIDRIVLHRVFGIPLFLGVMYLLFQMTFTLADPLMTYIEEGFSWLAELVAGFWPNGSDSPLKSLLVDGAIAGAGGVLVFLPNILLLFLAIALLEDSGYLARAAFIMDGLMRKTGLPGKSFIPMLLGFGCSVPGIMATRTLDSQKSRLITMLVLPLMSCGARLPIYALFIPAFFPAGWQAPVLWLIYLFGIVLAIIVAKIANALLITNEETSFVMELPPYRIPTLQSIAFKMCERAFLYLRKAGTLILSISVLLWALSSYPQKQHYDQDYAAQEQQALASYQEQLQQQNLTQPFGAENIRQLEQAYEQQLATIQHNKRTEDLSYSLAGRIGHAMEPLLKPMGFDWRIGTALIGAFAAKEVFVAQMGIVFSLGETDEGSTQLREQLKKHYSPLVGFCIMLFCLISAPCMATIAVTRRESNSWKWALLQLGGLTLLAYLVTIFIYQTGNLLQLGTGSKRTIMYWETITVLAIVVLAIAFVLRRAVKRWSNPSCNEHCITHHCTHPGSDGCNKHGENCCPFPHSRT